MSRSSSDGSRKPLAERAERAVERVVVGEPQRDVAARDEAFELVGGAFGDQPSVVEEGNAVGWSGSSRCWVVRKIVTPQATNSRTIWCMVRRLRGSRPVVSSSRKIMLDTVNKHVSHLLDKLGATNCTETVARARELGLIL